MNFNQQKGIAIVEFTLVLPVMLLLIYATAEFSRVLYQYNLLTQLTRDAGRYISLAGHAIPDTTGVVDLTDEIKTETRNILLYGTRFSGSTPLLDGLNVADISITEVGAGIIVISVSYDWSPIVGDVMPTFGFGADIDLSFNLNTAYAVRAI